MRGRVEHIQAYLDRWHKGLRLEWNKQIPCWVLTDFLYHPNGQRDRWSRTPSTQGYRGISGEGSVNRVVLFRFQDSTPVIKGDEREDFRPMAPCLGLLIRVLRLSFHGARVQAVNAKVDALEIGEDQASIKAMSDQRSFAREAAENAWKRAAGRVITGAGVYTDSRKIDRDIAKRMREEKRGSEEMDEAVAEQIREGKVNVQQVGGR